jgi:hypothetical protein
MTFLVISWPPSGSPGVKRLGQGPAPEPQTLIRRLVPNRNRSVSTHSRGIAARPSTGVRGAIRVKRRG